MEIITISFISSFLLIAALNKNYICDSNELQLTIRNNINGDFKEIISINEIKPGAFININWNNKNLMLPYSPRRGYVSFSDKKWDFRYEFDADKKLKDKTPTLYEMLDSKNYIEHNCNNEVS